VKFCTQIVNILAVAGQGLCSTLGPLREIVIECMLMGFNINETLRLEARQTVKLQKPTPHRSRMVCLKMSPSAAFPLVCELLGFGTTVN